MKPIAAQQQRKSSMATKKVIELNGYIARAIESDGHDVKQVTLALQSAANDVKGVEGDTKSSDAKKGKVNKKPVVQWKDTTTTDYVAVPSGPLEFLAWHDAVSTVFEKHGQPGQEIGIGIVPANHYVWLCTMRTKREKKSAKDNGPTGKRSAGIKDLPPVNAPA